MIFVNAVAKYTKDMTKKPVAEQHIEMKKPVTAETYRAAAYRLLEHIRATRRPVLRHEYGERGGAVSF